MVVRYRIDGVLRQVMKIPRNAGLPLISRIKIMSGLDIADRLRPQDGRARVSVNGEPVDLRVSTLPASLGEKVVIRILSQRDHGAEPRRRWGCTEDEQEAVKRLLTHKEGIILVTGPTGSGKTTTLYSALRLVQSEGVNIVTVEDPVEYRLGENIVQVQVHEKAGLTFASALRSILRQDPDVVLVGEIRDQETAQIALQASLTGHLVLSTLHTNDAPNAVTRLVDMGMEPYKIASALRGVVAQRLMRRLCKACRMSSHRARCPSGSRGSSRRDATLFSAVGCPECAHDRVPRPLQHRGSADDEPRARAPDRPGRHRRPDRRGGAAPTACARSGRAGCATCSPASPRWRSCCGSPTCRVEEEPRRAPAPARSDRRGRLPRAAAAPPAAGDDGSVARRSTSRMELELVDEPLGRGPRRPPRAGAGTCVLLVEDEEQLRRVMKDLLEREGYTVAEARDGVQALDQVDRFAPDVIILDLNLPGLDGYSVLHAAPLPAGHPRHSGHGPHRQGRRGQRGAGVRAGRRRLHHQAVPGPALSARLEAVLGRHRA